MSKRSNIGKAYFYAMGQRDRLVDVEFFGLTYHIRKIDLQHTASWTFKAWHAGYQGY